MIGQSPINPAALPELAARIEQVETDLANWKATAFRRGERLGQAEQAVQRVRELHRPIPVTVNFDAKPTDFCKCCYEDRAEDAKYPCPTIRALDGDPRAGV